MIRALYITHYVGLGGGETALLNLAGALGPHGFAPPHLLIPHEGALGERWRALGGTVHVRPFRGATTWFIPRVWARFPAVSAFERVIRDEAITLVHSDYHALPFAFPAAERAGVPCVWTCWGWWFRPKVWQRAFFRRIPLTLAASWAVRDGFLGQPPFMPAERAPVLAPGVDTARFHPATDGAGVRAEAGIPADAPTAALIARFQDVKGHDVFLAIARRVLDAVPDAHFLVAGEDVHGQSADAAYKARILADHAADARLRARVHYLGFRADAERVMAAADVVVCPSRFESYGMVNIEAMSTGRPVVSTRAGGPSETVRDGETGWLCTPGDVPAFADRIIALMGDPAARSAMGAAGRARVLAYFSVEAMAAQFAGAVRDLDVSGLGVTG